MFLCSKFVRTNDYDSNKSKFSSIGTRFKQQLVSLLEILNTTEPHYIRCIKPNNLLKPGIFENENILQQLCCGLRSILIVYGLLEKELKKTLTCWMWRKSSRRIRFKLMKSFCRECIDQSMRFANN